MALLGLLLLVGLVVGGFAVFAFAVLFKIERDQKKAEDNAPALLDEAFDGRPNVTFEVHARTLKYDTVVLGAKARGYTLAHQAGDPRGAMTLIFEKA